MLSLSSSEKARESEGKSLNQCCWFGSLSRSSKTRASFLIFRGGFREKEKTKKYRGGVKKSIKINLKIERNFTISMAFLALASSLIYTMVVRVRN